MGTLHCPNIDFSITPTPVQNTNVQFRFTPGPLLHWGLNIPVIISLGSAYSKPSDSNKTPTMTTTVLAHLDTGASITVIDVNLARRLKLPSAGVSQIKTAGGIKETTNFTIDLLFANSTLSPLVNLPIASADLGFDINRDLGNPQNFGMLIGRDVMSFWHISWDGQTSTVIIND